MSHKNVSPMNRLRKKLRRSISTCTEAMVAARAALKLPGATELSIAPLLNAGTWRKEITAAVHPNVKCSTETTAMKTAMRREACAHDVKRERRMGRKS